MNVSGCNLPLLFIALGSLVCARESRAQTNGVTAPVGYTQVSCNAASDTVVSVPFTKAPASAGVVQSVSGNVVTFAGAPGWSAGQFVYAAGTQSSTYYALLGPGSSGANPKEGCFYTITSNGTNTLTLSLNGDNIGGVPAGSAVTVIPYWTLGTVFPPAAAGTSFIATTNTLTPQTQVFLPNYSGTGINLSAAATYYFFNGAWRLFGDSVANSHNDDILIPDGYVTVRNPHTTTTLTAIGNVLMGKLTIPLAATASEAQDNFVSICRPLATSLNNLDLATSGAFTATTSPLSLRDRLFVFGNSGTGINDAPAATYFYYNGAWRQFGDLITNDHGGDLIPAASGFVVRKIASAGGNTAYWQNSPTY